MQLPIKKLESGEMVLEIPDSLLNQVNQLAQLSETLKGFSTEVALLKENDSQVAKLKEQIAELSDPAKLREKLMEIASTWTEDEYREIGEALGFSTTRALTAEEEAALKEDDQPETNAAEVKPTAPPKPKVFLQYGKVKYPVL
jgi:small-conductance mechanosensitive channel